MPPAEAPMPTTRKSFLPSPSGGSSLTRTFLRALAIFKSLSLVTIDRGQSAAQQRSRVKPKARLWELGGDPFFIQRAAAAVTECNHRWSLSKWIGARVHFRSFVNSFR